nr:MAG TPA: hypothetical protein [Caudoviricetes sp.]
MPFLFLFALSFILYISKNIYFILDILTQVCYTKDS